MTARLALMRHGMTAWNREHRIQGRTDIPLDADGIADLKRRALPQVWRRAVLWSSPLLRAVETARIIGESEPKRAEALMEQDWGAWEGERGADLRADPHSGFRDIEDWGWDYLPPGGESPAQMRARIVPWLSSLQRDNLAICHIGTMRVVLAIAHDWDFTGPCPFAIKRNRLYVLQRNGIQWQASPEPVRLEEVTP